MKTIKVGFPLISSNDWMGGYNYLLSLISALSHYESKQINAVLFYGADTPEDDLKPFEKITNIQLIKHEAFSKSSQGKGLLQALFLGQNLCATKVFQNEKIDVIFEPARFYGWRLPIPAIAWIPDFQHKHMPHLFGHLSWWKREIGFKIQMGSGRTILLSSNDARKDCTAFYNIPSTRIRVLQFPALIPPNLANFDTSILKSLYNLPDKFAYIPNQFWQHKNHEVVIEALGILKKEGHDITVICTGNTKDPRNANHYPNLLKRVKELGIENNFRSLGLIPREHAIGLLRSCTFLINPSFFEGWNTSVEEAKTFNTPMLLSNTGVHQEQASNKADYFDPENPKTLSRSLQKQMNKQPKALTTGRSLVQDSDKILGAFAREFTEIIQSSLIK